MSNYTKKISELVSTGTVPENGLIPVSLLGAEKETFKVSLNDVRANLLFENAYENLAAGISGTVKDELFYVYTDDSKLYAAAFTNVNGASAVAVYKDGLPVIYGTGKLMSSGSFGSYTSYVSYLYNDGFAIGGETEINLPFECFDVVEMFLGGSHQVKNFNYSFDPLTNKVKLAAPLAANATLVLYVRPYPGSPVTPVQPGITDYVNVAWLYNNGGAVGGETTLTPPWTFKSVPAIYLNGSKQIINLHYEIDSTGTKINLAKALKVNDIVEVILGGSRSIITAQVSGTPAEVLATLAATSGATKVNTSYGVSLEQVVQGFYGVNSFDDLRNRRPNFEGEKVNLKGYYVGGTSGGGEFIGRIGTGQLEDYGTIAVGNGFYWQRIIEGSKISTDFFGASQDGDITTPLQRAIDYAQSASLTNRFYGRPVITISAGYYTLSKMIKIPTSISIVAIGNVNLTASSGFSGSYMLKFTNENSSVSLNYWNGDNLSAEGGILRIDGLGGTVTTLSGIYIGNDASGMTNARNVSFRNVVVTNNYRALLFSSIDTYLFSATNCRFETNGVNLSVPSATSSNSGERMSFTNCTFGGAKENHIYITAPGFDASFVSCSFDFTSGSILVLDGNSASGYSAIKFIDCHMEAWDDYVVNVTGTPSNMAVYLTNCDLLPRLRNSKSDPDKGIANSPSRILFNGNGVALFWSGTEIKHEVKPYTEDLYMYSGGRNFAITGYVKDPFYHIPSANCILNTGFDFSSETTGTTVTSTSTPLSKFVISSISGITGVISDRTDITGKMLTLTGANSSSYINLVGSEYISCKAGDAFGVAAALQLQGSTGNNRITPYVWFYNDQKVLLSGGQVSGNNTAMGSVFSDTSLPNYSSGNSRFISSTPVKIRAPVGAAFARVAATFSDITGTVNVSRLSLFRFEIQ